MTTVLLIVHLMIAAAMVGVVLLQRSEGGALGIGGGGGGFMTGRGAANLLTRVTAGLAAAFFATSLLLSIIASRPEKAPSLLGSEPSTTQPASKTLPETGKEPAPTKAPEQPTTPGKGGILEKLETPTAPGSGSRLPQSK
jgi:preprotein translocase subunit SecG